jgi:hypothetical protein
MVDQVLVGSNVKVMDGVIVKWLVSSAVDGGIKS